MASLDYLISEKLLHFAEAAVSHTDFTLELPMLVAKVCRTFTAEEIREHLTVLVPRVRADAAADAEPGEDKFETISPEELGAWRERLSLIEQLLEVDQLGTS